MSRSQYVICNGAKSEVKFVETGVPQCSILGPLLFFFFFFLTYIYLSKHKYNKTYKVPHKTTQDEKYVQKW